MDEGLFMWERIVLAGIITFCIYLFLNLGGNSANMPSLDAKTEVLPKFINRIAFLNL